MESERKVASLTTIRASMMSLHVCRLASLVTSRNSSLVVFLICEIQSIDHLILIYSELQ